MARIRVFFAGTVQGVGFRYATQSEARGFQVTGWVRNRSDGRVEVLAEGPTSELEHFIRSIEQKMSGYVSSKSVTWEESSGAWTTFSIAPTE